MDKKLGAGLEAIAKRINRSTALAHPNDLAATVELLEKLVDAGHVADHPDEVTEYLTDKLKLPEDAVAQILLVYEVLVLRKGDPSGPYWKDDIVANL
jgi:hypothetical protein